MAKSSVTPSPTRITVRDVDPEVWKRFKSVAARYGATLGAALTEALTVQCDQLEEMERRERAIYDLRTGYQHSRGRSS